MDLTYYYFYYNFNFVIHGNYLKNMNLGYITTLS